MAIAPYFGSIEYFSNLISNEYLIEVNDYFVKHERTKDKPIHSIGLYLLMTYVCFFSIEATRMLNVADGLYTMVIGGFGMVAPVQGGIGAYHYIVKVGLMILDVSEDSAILFATVVHTAQTLMTLSVGGISILMVFLSKRKAKQ